MGKQLNRENQGTAIDRRKLLTAGPAFMTVLGAPVPFAQFLPSGLSPVALAQEKKDGHGKQGLSLLNERPLNMETPAHLLDDLVTPAERFFVRNNGVPPDLSDVDADEWTVDIDGEVDTPLHLSVAGLKARL